MILKLKIDYHQEFNILFFEYYLKTLHFKQQIYEIILKIIYLHLKTNYQNIQFLNFLN